MTVLHSHSGEIDKKNFQTFFNFNFYNIYKPWIPYNIQTIYNMPRKSKNAQKMTSSIVITRAFRYSSEIPDAEMITTPLETSSTSPIIIDLDNEDSPTELEEYAEDEDEVEDEVEVEVEVEDEQRYVREGEELEDIYEDDQLSELEGEDLEKTVKLVMENQMERIEQRKREQELTPYETVMQGASTSVWKKAESKRALGYSGPPAVRTAREHRQKARKAEEINKEINKEIRKG